MNTGTKDTIMKRAVLVLVSLGVLLLLSMMVIAHKHENLTQFDKIREHYEKNNIDNSGTKCPNLCEIFIIQRECLEDLFQSKPEKNTFVFKYFTFLNDVDYLTCVESKVESQYQ